MKSTYENEYEDELWIKMGAMRPGGTDLTKRLLGLCELPAGSRILDIACGIGETVKMLEESGYEAHGIDISEKLINVGRQLFPDARLEIADANFPPFEENYFDALIIQCSLKIIGAIALHILKKDGIIYISDAYDKDAPPQIPQDCEIISWQDVSEQLSGFAAKLAWNGIKPPKFCDASYEGVGYYIMAARK